VEDDGVLANVLTQVKGENREATLLTSATVVATYERCGTVAEAAGELSLRVSPADELPRCGPGAASYLRRITAGQFPFLQAEFLAALQAAGKRVPEELLPDVLETARKDSSLRLAVAGAIGRRGEWLATLNPDWNFVATQIAPEDWETATRADRVGLLRRLRLSNPERAVALLRSTWSSDAPEDRAAFIAEMAHGLSPKDEPFLEAALDDRRKEVRQRACELLMRLPQSGLVERMWHRVAPLVRPAKSSGLNLKKLLGKQSLEIELPEACDEAMQRDGIEAKPPQGTGEKAWWLQQMVRAIPPVRWEGHLHLAPQQCVSAADASEFNTALVPALADAVQRHNDPRWARPVVEIAIVHARDTGLAPAAAAAWGRVLDAVATIDESGRDAVIAKQLDQRGEAGDCALGLRLLHSCPGPWSPLLAKKLLGLLRYVTQQMAAGKIQTYWAGLGDLSVLACRLPVSVAQEFHENWPQDAADQNFFRPIQTILEILQFRSKMLREIKQ
jgi:hypothetical protein